MISLMKKLLQKIGLMLFALLASLPAFAADFVVDCIAYEVISITDLTCEVVCGAVGIEEIENIVIPAKVQYKNKTFDVTRIGNGAFKNYSFMHSIELPNSVTSIGRQAFYGCKSLQSIKLGNSLTSIGEYVFSICSSLQSIEIPNSVTSIGEYAFGNCTSLQSIEIPNSVTSIGCQAFYDCKSLQSIEIPNSVTSIGYRAFSYCINLKNIRLSENLEEINYGTFENCNSLETIIIPGSVKRVWQYYHNNNYDKEYYTFKNCTNLKSIRFEYDAPWLYFGCSNYYASGFEAINIGDWTNTLETIYIDRELNKSITYLESLKEIIIGENLGGSYLDITVRNAKNLSSITSYATTPPNLPSCTNRQYMDVVVRVPNEALEAYRQANVWRNFWNLEGFDPAGIDEVQIDSEKTEVARYNLLGAPVSEDYEGIVIVRYSDGSTKKFVNK